MRKKSTDQNDENGNWLMALGYATNAKPGPEAAISSIGICEFLAMKPKTENITSPESKQVPSLKIANIIVSL